MFGRIANFFNRTSNNQLVLPIYASPASLTTAEFLEKFNKDIDSAQLSQIKYHLLLKTLGLVIIGGGIVAGIYIVRHAKYLDATRDTSEATGCYDSCGIDSLITWIGAGFEGIGACVICCAGGALMALNPSYDDHTKISGLSSDIKSYVNDFIANQNPTTPITTVGELRTYCEGQLQRNTVSLSAS